MILSKHSWKVGTILYSRNSPGNVYQPESILKDYLSLNITSLIHRKQFKVPLFLHLHFSKVVLFVHLISVAVVCLFFYHNVVHYISLCVCSCSLVAESLWPHGLQSAELLCWNCNFPGKSIERLSYTYSRASFHLKN